MKVNNYLLILVVIKNMLIFNDYMVKIHKRII